MLFSRDERLIDAIRDEEETVVRLCSGITGYLVKLSALALNEREHKHVASLLQTLSDMERISDYCENISEYAQTMSERGAEFSEVGKMQLEEMISVCADSYCHAVAAFAGNDKAEALKVIEKPVRYGRGNRLFGRPGGFGAYFGPFQEYRGGSAERVARREVSRDAA